MLKTDHANLKFWLSDSSSPKIQRWRIALSEFEFDIEHIAGELNVVADALSRLSVLSGVREKDILISHFHCAVEGHSGVRQTVARMKEAGISWPGIDKDVASYVKTCPQCQRTSTAPRTSHGSQFSVDMPRPNQLVALDTVGPLEMDNDGYTYVLMLVDAMSRYTELMPLKSKEAPEYAYRLLEYVCKNGKPEEIKSDQARQFQNEISKEFGKLMGVPHHFSIAYSHHDNAMVERMVRELRRHLEALILEMNRPKDWSRFLPLVQRIINTRVNATTGFAPATLKFGFKNALESDLFAKPNADSSQEWVKAVSKLQDELTLRYEELCRGNVTLETPSSTTFTPGSWVLVDNVYKVKSKVAGAARSGPFRVLQQCGNEVFLADPVSTQPRRVHVSRCREYHAREGEDPLLEAVKYTDQFLVERIISHTFKPPKARSERNLYLTVLWTGYPEPEEHLADKSLLKTSAFLDYVEKHPELSGSCRKA